MSMPLPPLFFLREGSGWLLDFPVLQPNCFLRPSPCLYGCLRSLACCGQLRTTLFLSAGFPRFCSMATLYSDMTADYILADLLNIPNLAQRSLQYIGYLINRYVFGNSRIEIPNVAPGERFWFLFYGAASFCYRIIIYGAILLFVAGRFFIIGVILAVWGGIALIGLPVYRKVHSLLSAPHYQAGRNRAILIVVTAAAGLLLLFFLLPFPYLSHTQGVVWVPEDSQVRAKTDGIVEKVLNRSNRYVEKNDVLIECRYLSWQRR